MSLQKWLVIVFSELFCSGSREVSLLNFVEKDVLIVFMSSSLVLLSLLDNFNRGIIQLSLLG